MLPSDVQRSTVPVACEVDVAEGILTGHVEAGIRVFKGIPFARPPVGALRFRPPEPAERWAGVRAATAFAAAAPQPPDLGLHPNDPDAMPPVPMSEDCLYLNVWAPPTDGPHPVLVWLHGGSQILGGTARPVYDGAVFARRGIVCVTVGFRLAALGYLELGELIGPDYAESGNTCLADQLAGLRWVHANVAAFGGDPQRITLGGESAGAKNAAALMASPLAEGLFQAAILQSGGGDTVHDIAHAQATARRFLAEAGVSAADLLTLPVAAILAAQDRVLAGGGRRFPFRPISGTALLPEPPPVALRRQRAETRALLIGSTRDELGVLFSDAELQNGWDESLLAHRTVAEMAEIEKAAAALLPDLAVVALRRRLLVAEEYRVPSIRLADAHAAAGGETWMYRFDLPLPPGPLAGTAPHNADLSPSWARPSRYDALPGRPAAHMHEIVVEFVHRQRAAWPTYVPPRRTTALIADTLTPADNPSRQMLELFSRWHHA